MAADAVQWASQFDCSLERPVKTRFLISLALAFFTGTAAQANPGSPLTPSGEPSASTGELEQPSLANGDPCLASTIAATPSRPNWTAGAQTTQCNVLEFDAGWVQMPIGRGVSQTIFPASVRYGLTPRLDLRWGMPSSIRQSSRGSPQLLGVSDQSFSVTYRVLDQRRRSPALAFSYVLKDPRANPAKGLGSGYIDHQVILIASRDLGRTHFDFNLAGTLAGSSSGKDGATQAGLVAAIPLARSVTWLIEGDGGSQPGTSDRYGASLSGISWALRPSLVADAGFAHAFTSGTPRAQITIGITYSVRSGIAPLPRNSRLARWLGR